MTETDREKNWEGVFDYAWLHELQQSAIENSRVAHLRGLYINSKSVAFFWGYVASFYSFEKLSSDFENYSWVAEKVLRQPKFGKQNGFSKEEDKKQGSLWKKETVFTQQHYSSWHSR